MMEDIIGKVLDAYTARENAKLEARMQASREQIAAYDLASRYANPQADAGNATASRWLPLVGLGVLGLIVYAVAK